MVVDDLIGDAPNPDVSRDGRQEGVAMQHARLHRSDGRDRRGARDLAQQRDFTDAATRSEALQSTQAPVSTAAVRPRAGRIRATISLGVSA